jgi:hypothetical protein
MDSEFPANCLSYGARADDVLDSLIALWSAQRIQLGQAEAIIGGEEEYKPTEIIWA